MTKLRLASVALVSATAALAGCAGLSGSDLQSLQGRKVDVAVGGEIAVWLEYDGYNGGASSGCVTLDDVDATFNGVSVDPDQIDLGGWVTVPDGGGRCDRPYFAWLDPVAGSGTLHIADDSAAIDVTIPDAMATRSVALSGSDAVVQNESTVTFVPSIPSTDTVTEVDVEADDTSCAGVLFDVSQTLTGSAGDEVTLPDADSALRDCYATLSPLPIVFTTEISTAAQVTTCSGASSCSATGFAQNMTTVTFDP